MRALITTIPLPVARSGMRRASWIMWSTAAMLEPVLVLLPPHAMQHSHLQPRLQMTDPQLFERRRTPLLLHVRPLLMMNLSLRAMSPFSLRRSSQAGMPSELCDKCRHGSCQARM